MWGGRFVIAVRSEALVCPVRTSTRSSGRAGSRARISASGTCRFFWTSFESARKGETYTTCVSSRSSGPCAKRPSIAERKPARVLPEPVGAATSTFFPACTSGQPSRWGGVGSPSRVRNQVSTAGWKEGGDPIAMILPSYPSRGRLGSAALLEIAVHIDDHVRRARGRAAGDQASRRAHGDDRVVPPGLPRGPVERGGDGSGGPRREEAPVAGAGRGRHGRVDGECLDVARGDGGQ